MEEQRFPKPRVGGSNPPWGSFLLSLGLAGWGVAAGPVAAYAAEERRVLDLTHELAEGIPVFPGGVPFQLEAVATFDRAGYFANRLELGEHTGTHIDAPIHFRPDGLAVEQLSPSQLIGPGVRISVAEEVSANPDATLDGDELSAWEHAHEPIPPGAIVCVQTGWARRWPDEAAYRNTDEQGVMHFPGVSAEAARWLVERQIAGLGIDTFSIDPGSSTTFEAHRILAEANIVVIENLANLDHLPPRGFTVVVAPLIIRGGSGSPARILAVLEPPTAPSSHPTE